MPNAFRLWRPADWQVFILAVLFGLLATVQRAHAQEVAVPNVFGDSLAARYSHRVPTGYCLTTRLSHDTAYVVGITSPSEMRVVVVGGIVQAVAFACEQRQAVLLVHPDSTCTATGCVAADSGQFLTRAERLVLAITQAPFAIVQFGDRLYYLHRPVAQGVAPAKAAS